MPSSSYPSTAAAAAAAAKRGLLIVLEGPDRSGKTTLANKLCTELREKQGLQAKQMAFPDRYGKVNSIKHSFPFQIQLILDFGHSQFSHNSQFSNIFCCLLT